MFIRYNELNEVTFIHEMPELMSDKDKSNGIIIDNVIPKPINQVGKDNVLCIDLEKREFYFKYVDRPLNEEELAEQQRKKISQLEAENLELKQAIAEITMMISTPSI